MKMKKIAVILMLALASSAFGAVTLTAPHELNISTGSAVLPISIIVDQTGVDPSDGTSPFPGTNGFSVFLLSNAGGQASLTARSAVVAPLIVDFTKTDSNIGLPYTIPAAADPNKDLGSTTSTDNLMSYSGVYMNLTIAAPASAIGKTVTILSSWGNPTDFGNYDLAPVVVTLTPEPASMLLLAAGAAFFARRRRA